MKELDYYYNRIIQFNDTAGVKNATKINEKFWKSVKLQADLIVEEAQEVLGAAESKDDVELLDGAVDVMVVALKILDFLISAGYDVEGAFESVCNNNDQKVFSDYYKVVDALFELENRDGVEYDIASTFVNGIEFYTIRRQDGKIVKPVGFTPVDLTPFVPTSE